MRRRLRKAGFAFLVLTTFVLVGIHVLAAYAPREVFSVRKIVVTGNRQVDADSILAMAGAKTGGDIFETDLRSMADAVRQHPWIGSASVSRILPSTLRIAVHERRPLALVAVGDLLVVDDDGILLPNEHPELVSDLPVLTGLTARSNEIGEPLHGPGSSELVLALRAIRARYPELAARVSELSWMPDVGVVATLVGSATGIILGDDDFGQRLDRLVPVLRYLDHRDHLANFRYLDARFAGQVVGKHRSM